MPVSDHEDRWQAARHGQGQGRIVGYGCSQGRVGLRVAHHEDVEDVDRALRKDRILFLYCILLVCICVKCMVNKF